nr:PorT family protein [Bacteroidota bacterium]
MKKNISGIALFAMLMPAFIYSQTFDFGFKAGITISDIRMTNMPQNHVNIDKPDIWKHDFASKPGLNLSINGGYHVNQSFYLGVEPGYILKGAKFTSSESKLDLHYLNLPVVLKYKVSNRTGIYLGPEFSVLLKARLDYNGQKIDMTGYYNGKPESSLLMGIDYQATSVIGFGIRYNWGLTKVSETVWTDEQGNLDSKCREYNHYFLIYMFFIFG